MVKFREPIIVDVDDVCCDFAGSALNLIKEKTGIIHSKKELVGYDIFKTLGYPIEMLTDAVLYDGFCKKIKPYDGIRETLQLLEKEFGDVYICTAPYNDLMGSEPRWMSQRAQWIKAHLGYDLNRQIHTKSKFLVKGKVIIDDNAENLKKWSDEFIYGYPILYTQTWNSKEHLFDRADSWTQVFERLESFFHVQKNKHVD